MFILNRVGYPCTIFIRGDGRRRRRRQQERRNYQQELKMMLNCKHCIFSTCSGKELFNHVLLYHTITRLPRVNCGYQDCPVTFSTLNRFESHILQFHNRESMSSGTEEDEQNNQSNKMLQCTHNDCNYFTKNKATLRSHVFRNHGKNTLEQKNSCDDQSLVTETMILDDDNIHININKEEELLTVFAHLYLVLHSKHNIPNTTLQFIIEKYRILINESNQLLEEKMVNAFYDKGYNKLNI